MLSLSLFQHCQLLSTSVLFFICWSISLPFSTNPHSWRVLNIHMHTNANILPCCLVQMVVAPVTSRGKQSTIIFPTAAAVMVGLICCCHQCNRHIIQSRLSSSTESFHNSKKHLEKISAVIEKKNNALHKDKNLKFYQTTVNGSKSL